MAAPGKRQKERERDVWSRIPQGKSNFIVERSKENEVGEAGDHQKGGRRERGFFWLHLQSDECAQTRRVFAYATKKCETLLEHPLSHATERSLKKL